jgi:hypothetical protein
MTFFILLLKRVVPGSAAIPEPHSSFVDCDAHQPGSELRFVSEGGEFVESLEDSILNHFLCISLTTNN